MRCAPSAFGWFSDVSTGAGRLQIGCEVHTFERWRELAESLGAENDYSPLDVEIYKLHIEHCARVAQLLWNKEALRRSEEHDALEREALEREALERLNYREYRQEMTRGWQKRAALLIFVSLALCAVGVWLVLR